MRKKSCQEGLSGLLRHARPWKDEKIPAEVRFCRIQIRGKEPIPSTCVVGSLKMDNQSKPHNINIYDVLVKVVNSRAQPQSQNADTQFSEEGGEGDTPVNKEKGACAANEKPEGTILGKVEKSITKSANQKVKPRDAEEDEQKVFKTKVNPSTNPDRLKELKKNGTG